MHYNLEGLFLCMFPSTCENVSSCFYRMSSKEEISKIIRYCEKLNDGETENDSRSAAFSSPCLLQPSPSSSPKLGSCLPLSTTPDLQEHSDGLLVGWPLSSPVLTNSTTPSPTRCSSVEGSRPVTVPSGENVLLLSSDEEKRFLDNGCLHTSDDDIFDVLTPPSISSRSIQPVSSSPSSDDCQFVVREEGKVVLVSSSSSCSDVVMCGVQQVCDGVLGVGKVEVDENLVVETEEEVQADVNVVVETDEEEDVNLVETVEVEENVNLMEMERKIEVDSKVVDVMDEEYQFDSDSFLEAMAENFAGQGSPHALHTSSQPPPFHHTPTHHVSLSQSPVAPVRGLPSFITPALVGRRTELYSDDNITPMPHYHNMRTPQLKGECSRFGVKAIPKRKMIAKLKEIYTYTHPLVGMYMLELCVTHPLMVCTCYCCVYTHPLVCMYMLLLCVHSVTSR